jgi:ABC-type nickel/cobalt efflux system permease component RcnA
MLRRSSGRRGGWAGGVCRPLVAALFVLPLLWCLAPRGASAHPAPSVLHDYIVSMTEEALHVVSYLRVSPELVPEVYRQIDRDGDGRTSDAEHEAWLRTHPAMLRVAIDGLDVALEMGGVAGVSREDLLLSIEQPIVVRYAAALPRRLTGKQRVQLTYGDSYLTYDEYYLSVAGDAVGDLQPRNVSRPHYPATFQLIYHIAPEGHPGRLAHGRLAPAPWSATATPTGATDPDSAVGGDPMADAPPAPAATPAGSGTILERLRSWRGEPLSALVMLLLAVGIGALHALTPGHGKAVVAAYLVGSHGRVRDAILLGGVITFTHTAGVLALGLVLLLVSSFAMPRALQSGLELVSGALIVVLGLSLLVARAHQLWGRPADADAHQHRHHDPAHGGSYRPRFASGTSSGGDRAHAHAHGWSPHAHSHAQDGPGGHGHSHGPIPRIGGARALVGLGVSGGLVPCPDALAILLLAVGVGQVGLGLGLVTSFSLGVATVITALGVSMVKIKGMLEHHASARVPASAAWGRWVPVMSAGVVVVVGALMVISSLGGLGLA